MSTIKIPGIRLCPLGYAGTRGLVGLRSQPTFCKPSASLLPVQAKIRVKLQVKFPGIPSASSGQVVSVVWVGFARGDRPSVFYFSPFGIVPFNHCSTCLVESGNIDICLVAKSGDTRRNPNSKSRGGVWWVQRVLRVRGPNQLRIFSLSGTAYLLIQCLNKQT